MLDQPNTQNQTDRRRLPAHLKGTRAGLFYLLNASHTSEPDDAPAPARKASEPMAHTHRPAATVALAQWQAIAQMDDFHFAD